jgi:DNA-binding NarL/FixJ family response regulator
MDKELFKIYFEFEQRKADIKRTIAELEEEKEYILDTLKAMTLSDMPKGTSIGDISNHICHTDEIDTLIQQQTQQLQRIHGIYLRVKELMDKLTEQQQIVLEKRVYGCKVFVISQRVHIHDKTFYKIKNIIKNKIGIDILRL